jgi:hypothetical protein
VIERRFTRADHALGAGALATDAPQGIIHGRDMPSSDLAFRTLYAAIDARAKVAPFTDIFVETGGAAATHTMMFMFRATPQARFGMFSRVDKRCATAPRVSPISTELVAGFLAELPALSLAPIAIHTQIQTGVVYEVRIRDPHFDVTLHFADPREPRSDLIALGRAIQELGARLTE